MSMENSIREQYERFPYPPGNFLALPKRNQGQSLRYELGSQLTQGSEKSHQGKRILVAGAGTLEALVVAQMHPLAKEVVAVDWSENSLKQLHRRILFARLTRFPLRIPPMRLICGDLYQVLESELPFDYILASNVIHHSSDPKKLLCFLSKKLKIGGLLRLVTYPQSSRIWMRQISLWFHVHGVTSSTPRLVQKCRQLIDLFPQHHPIRLCFETCPESKTQTGIVDAWMNACENPLSPLEWKLASLTAGLRPLGETQRTSSRSSFLDEICPELQALEFWDKLQILDDLLEICANPTLWFEQEVPPKEPPLPLPSAKEKLEFHPSTHLGMEFKIPSKIFWEMKKGLLKIEKILQKSGISFNLKNLFERFIKEVGPRVDPQNPNKTLIGLALSDYPLKDILNTQIPWSSQDWDSLQSQYKGKAVLTCPLSQMDSDSSKDWKKVEQKLQLQFGHLGSTIPIRIII